MKQKIILIVVALALAFTSISMASAAGFSETHTFHSVLEYTVYDKGRFVDDEKDTMTQYHYPDVGGMLMIHCVEIDDVTSDEKMARLVIKALIQSSDKASENPVRYWSKDIVISGYYACHSRAACIANGMDAHDNSYWIITSTHIVSLHFIDTAELGAYPSESIPYVIASLNILS